MPCVVHVVQDKGSIKEGEQSPKSLINHKMSTNTSRKRSRIPEALKDTRAEARACRVLNKSRQGKPKESKLMMPSPPLEYRDDPTSIDVRELPEYVEVVVGEKRYYLCFRAFVEAQQQGGRAKLKFKATRDPTDTTKLGPYEVVRGGYPEEDYEDNQLKANNLRTLMEVYSESQGRWLVLGSAMNWWITKSSSEKQPNKRRTTKVKDQVNTSFMIAALC
jgi:hypothetical protein